jgi:hypothetical protein
VAGVKQELASLEQVFAELTQEGNADEPDPSRGSAAT